jgi:predicted PurR-regulated permease PerM
VSWLGGRLISMAIVGALSIGALHAIGVPGALFLGVFTGLVCFIPLIGPILSAVPPLVLALAGNPIDALWVLLAYVVIQQVESNLLTPSSCSRLALCTRRSL